MGKKNNRKRRTSGFADTKKVPHENHPAYYEVENQKAGKGKTPIRYVTFTHSDEVELSNENKEATKKVKTIPLPDNINPTERGQVDENGKPLKSHVYPRVYKGERGALGKENKKYSLTKASKEVIERVFKESPTVTVKHTSNSQKKK